VADVNMPHCLQIPIGRPLPGGYFRALAGLVIVCGLTASGGAIALVGIDAGAVPGYGSPELGQAWCSPVGVLLTIVAVQAVIVGALLRERGWQRRAKHEAQRRETEFTHAVRLSTMGVFAASIAHELNQPLGAILTNADAADIMLDQEQPDLAELRRIVHDIRKDDQRASEVIRGLDTLLRRRDMRFVRLDLNTEVSQALHHLALDAASRKVRIIRELAADVPAVAGNSVQLQQVLINLVVNAMEAMEATPERDREVHVLTRACRGGAEIAVTDRGPGISAAAVGRLLVSFFTSKPGGMGLGLTIVRSIIDAHRGMVSAGPAPAAGAVFKVWLPASST
jgi:C4-dicarboxylate-specific signal transduction histidine kinase